MKLEEVMYALRSGERICRKHGEDYGLRFFNPEFKEEFCISLDDILADDWQIDHESFKDAIEKQIKNNEETIKHYAGVMPDYPLSMKSTQYPEGIV